MRYLGTISGNGVLRRDGKDIARASYDFEGFSQQSFGITCSGEIQVAASALASVFGRKGVQLLTDDGRLLDLRFSEKELLAAAEFTHVEVTGGLQSSPRTWRH
jgi:hypothetical protein